MNKNLIIKVISMDTSIERRDYIEKLMKRYSLEYSFFNAVNGKKSMTCDYYKKAINSHFMFNRKYMLSPSEYGCMYSHLLMLKDFIENNREEWLIVLEDDVIFDNKLSYFINNFKFENLNKNKIYILGGQEGLKSRRLIFGKYAKIDNYDFKYIYNFSNRWVYRTCCYLVNKTTAKEMLKIYQNFNIVADDWTFIRRKSLVDGLVLLNIVKHPEDLQNSLIEKERH